MMSSENFIGGVLFNNILKHLFIISVFGENIKKPTDQKDVKKI